MALVPRIILTTFVVLATALCSMSFASGMVPVPFLQEQPDSNLKTTRGRPRGIPISLESEWLVDSDFELSTQSAAVKLPLLFGSGPPPIVKFGVAFTDLSAADSLDLPDRLYEYSTGLSWIKKFNERWTLRTMLGMDFATDNENTSSDSWQFTGGVFAIHQKNPTLSWTFGAIALGRRDLPVVPAIGAVWLPRPGTRVDLIMPNPKVNFLLSDNGQRQQWAYLGAGINGNTWGYERENFGDDTLTYGDLRVVAGWESRPSAPTNRPYVPGRKFGLEFGYAFSRDLEIENGEIEIPLEDAMMFRISTRY